MLTNKQRRLFYDMAGDIVPEYREETISAREKVIDTVMQIIERELTHRQRTVIVCIYLNNMTRKEVCEYLGIGRSEVSRIHKRAIDRIRKYTGYSSLR